MPENTTPEYMRLNKYEANVLTQLDSSYSQFLLQNGTMIVKLKRALYGCVESARLWYEHISTSLKGLGFSNNPHDICVFNRVEEDKSQTTFVLHVDDGLITAKNEVYINKVISQLKAIYGDLSIQRGKKIDYLGMTFDFEKYDGKCEVSMNGYIDDLLKFAGKIEGVATTPATNKLFSIDAKSPLLLTSEKEYFHSLTAKVFYLAKRVRPELLTTTSFLTKRVQQPTQQDMVKLERVIKYLRGTKSIGMILEADKQLAVMAYVDASYAVHDNYRSHTGTVIGIGRGPVFCKSTTQKINTKSSTEAELVGLSDATGQIVWTRNFLIAQGYDVLPSTIYQDNMSTISIIKNGRSTSDRTKHIAVRFYFVTDRIKNGEIKVEYLNTGQMIADILTKPLQGSRFVELRKRLLNLID